MKLPFNEFPVPVVLIDGITSDFTSWNGSEEKFVISLNEYLIFTKNV